MNGVTMIKFHTVIAVLISIFMLSVAAQAFEDEDLQKLKSEKACNDCDLKNVELSKMSFTNADLEETNFKEAVLSDLDLSGSNLEDADFSGAKLTNVNFTGAKLKSANFENSILLWVNFNGANLDSAKFEESTMKGVSFKDANLDDAEFDDANKSLADFTGGLEMKDEPCGPGSFGECKQPEEN